MEQENLLDDPQSTYVLQQRVKMRYLETQKQRLQLLVSELSQNLCLLRHTNQSLIKSTPDQANRKLNQQNSNLQKSYLRILQENESLIAQSFLQKQISAQENCQFQQHLKNYEQKILQLRRALQMKEGFVQTLENNNKYHVTSNTNSASPHSITMLYYQELQDYKDTIEQIKTENIRLKNENSNLRKDLSKYKTRYEAMERMTIGQTAYYDFKRWVKENYNQQKQSKTKGKINRNKSESKLQREKPIRQLKIKPICVCQFQDANESNNLKTGETKINYVGKAQAYASMLVKKKMENQKLIEKAKQLTIRLQNSQQANKKIKQANLAYQKNRRQIFDQLNYYKKTTQEMLKILTRRKAISKQNCRSLQKSQVQQIIRKAKMPSQITYVSQRKGLWSRFKQQITKQTTISDATFPQLLPKRRPLSCVNDYIKFQDDQVDKYLVKQRNMSSKPQVITNLQDFSVMLDQYIENDDKDPFDFSVIKPKQRVSYADMKKQKNNIKKQGLTLIEEDIF